MRGYDYNQDDFQSLFVQVVEKLSSSVETVDIIANILAKVCRHFQFGVGFIYEMDHAGVLHLKERYAPHARPALNHAISLAEPPPRAQEGEGVPGIHDAISPAQPGEDAMDDLCRTFDANSILLVPVLDDGKRLVGIVGMMDRRHDILPREQDAHAAETVLRLLANYVKLRIYQHRVEMARQSIVDTLDNAGIDVYVNDFHTHEILYVNKSMAAPYGGLDVMLGKKCWSVLYDDKAGPCEYCPKDKLLDESGHPTKAHSWDYQRPFDGSWFRVICSAFTWVDGRLAHIVSSVDITESKRNEAMVARLANFDALTNLPNRRKLRADFNLILEKPPADGRVACLLFIDLDKFKPINDRLGHQIGDDLLREIGRTFTENPLTGGHAYRHGGDEFVLFFGDVARDDIARIGAVLLDIFETPWRVGGQSVVCRASVGGAVYPDDGLTIEELIRCADKRMYKAKHTGKGVEVEPPFPPTRRKTGPLRRKD